MFASPRHEIGRRSLHKRYINPSERLPASFRHYSAAAAQGHADASYCLGVMYYTTGDFEAAFHCYQAAAESGNMLAWRNLASMYALGEGVARSEQMAKHIMTTLRDKIELQEKSEEGNGRGQGDTGQADR